jgi:hypothetical protein
VDRTGRSIDVKSSNVWASPDNPGRFPSDMTAVVWLCLERREIG